MQNYLKRASAVITLLLFIFTSIPCSFADEFNPENTYLNESPVTTVSDTPTADTSNSYTADNTTSQENSCNGSSDAVLCAASGDSQTNDAGTSGSSSNTDTASSSSSDYNSSDNSNAGGNGGSDNSNAGTETTDTTNVNDTMSATENNNSGADINDTTNTSTEPTTGDTSSDASSQTNIADTSAITANTETNPSEAENTASAANTQSNNAVQVDVVLPANTINSSAIVAAAPAPSSSVSATTQTSDVSAILDAIANGKFNTKVKDLKAYINQLLKDGQTSAAKQVINAGMTYGVLSSSSHNDIVGYINTILSKGDHASALSIFAAAMDMGILYSSDRSYIKATIVALLNGDTKKNISLDTASAAQLAISAISHGILFSADHNDIIAYIKTLLSRDRSSAISLLSFAMERGVIYSADRAYIKSVISSLLNGDTKNNITRDTQNAVKLVNQAMSLGILFSSDSADIKSYIRILLSSQIAADAALASQVFLSAMNIGILKGSDLGLPTSNTKNPTLFDIFISINPSAAADAVMYGIGNWQITAVQARAYISAFLSKGHIAQAEKITIAATQNYLLVAADFAQSKAGTTIIDLFLKVDSKSASKIIITALDNFKLTDANARVFIKLFLAKNDITSATEITITALNNSRLSAADFTQSKAGTAIIDLFLKADMLAAGKVIAAAVDNWKLNEAQARTYIKLFLNTPGMSAAAKDLTLIATDRAWLRNADFTPSKAGNSTIIDLFLAADKDFAGQLIVKAISMGLITASATIKTLISKLLDSSARAVTQIISAALDMAIFRRAEAILYINTYLKADRNDIALDLLKKAIDSYSGGITAADMNGYVKMFLEKNDTSTALKIIDMAITSTHYPALITAATVASYLKLFSGKGDSTTVVHIIEKAIASNSYPALISAATVKAYLDLYLKIDTSTQKSMNMAAAQSILLSVINSSYPTGFLSVANLKACLTIIKKQDALFADKLARRSVDRYILTVAEAKPYYK